MADPATYRPGPGEIPDQPGVYRFRDAHGRVIYVGKAKSLRQRLNSYFADLARCTRAPRRWSPPRRRSSGRWCATEVEALQLEYSWIKEFDPRFNVQVPRRQVLPVPRGDDGRGVPARAGDARRQAQGHPLLRPVRARLGDPRDRRPAAAGLPGPHLLGRGVQARRPDRPALPARATSTSARRPASAGSAPRSTARSPRTSATSWPGSTDAHIRRLEKRDAGGRGRAGLRAGGPAARRHRGAEPGAWRRTRSCCADATDADVFALAEDELEAAVQVFHVRGGRVRGQRGWVVEKVEDVTTGDLVEHLLQQVYGERAGRGGARARCWCPRCPPDADALAELARPGCAGPAVERAGAAARRQAGADGDRARNAGQALALHKTRRAGDLTTRSQALQEIAGGARAGRGAAADRVLRRVATSRAPRGRPRWWCSRTAWPARASTAGSRSRGVERTRTTSPRMHEVITRRFRRYLAERSEPGAELDGQRARAATARPAGPRGPTRPTAARRPGSTRRPAAAQVRLPAEPGRRRRRPAAGRGRGAGDGRARASTTSRCAGWRSGWRRSGCPARTHPLVLPRTSEGLYLLQRVRDEAHRFAITYHRQRRARR